MPRKAHIEDHFTAEELEAKYRKSSDPVESRRWHLLWKIRLGWSILNSAVAVGLTYSYAQTILRKYNQQGAQSVKNGKKQPARGKRGKPPLLNDTQLTKLKQALKEKPEDGGKWTGPKVARWIAKETGKEKVAKQRGWDYLKKCAYSWQRPRPKHRKGDKQEQEAFKQNLPKLIEDLKIKYPDAEVEVWFFDEHRVGLKPILCKVWSPIGERPIAEVQPGYEWLYAYAFVNPKTGETCWYLLPRVNVKWFNLALEHFAREVGAGKNKIALVIEDQAGWHRSQKVELPEGVITQFLPPYSPELQPAERLWPLADEPLVNRYFETIEELEEVLAQRCCVLQKDMKEEIRALTNFHWLTYT